MTSEHLDKIIESQNRNINLQVVFCDIEKYSERRSLTQMAVIDNFTKCLSKAKSEISKEFVEYAQSNDLNFLNDLIVIPTGDGAAVVFSFNGLNDIHLSFAKRLLEECARLNEAEKCEKFSENGWCNCHNGFNLKVGVSEGKGIIYRDANGNYNVAGSVINMAARVLGFSERNQVIFTESAYNQLIDMVDDPYLVDKFKPYTKVRIKHGRQINVYQYVDSSLSYINSNPPKELELSQRAAEIIDKFPMKVPEPVGKEAMLQQQEHFLRFMEGMASMLDGPSQVTKIKIPEAEIRNPVEEN